MTFTSQSKCLYLFALEVRMVVRRQSFPFFSDVHCHVLMGRVLVLFTLAAIFIEQLAMMLRTLLDSIVPSGNHGRRSPVSWFAIKPRAAPSTISQRYAPLSAFVFLLVETVVLCHWPSI